MTWFSCCKFFASHFLLLLKKIKNLKYCAKKTFVCSIFAALKNVSVLLSVNSMDKFDTVLGKKSTSNTLTHSSESSM